MDILNIEITEDGRIKVATDKISMANHTNADAFLNEVFKLMGGEVQREKNSKAHHHHHHHHDDHDHQH